MDPLIIAIIVAVFTLIVLFSGIPIAFGLSFVSIVLLVSFEGFQMLDVFAETFYAGLNSFVLLSIPMFILMGMAVANSPAGKDLSSTLFVDCSIEYELPNAPKIPKNSAPILMMVPNGFKHPSRTSAPSRVVQQPAKPVAVPAVATAPASIAKCNGHRGGAQCQCTASNASNATPAIVKDGRGLKRSYATAMSNDFYKHLNQPQPHPNQSAG